MIPMETKQLGGKPLPIEGGGGFLEWISCGRTVNHNHTYCEL